MDYTIGLSEDGTYVVLKIVGEFTGASVMAAVEEAHVFGRRHGVDRYLTDVRESRNVDSVLGNYDFAYKNMPQSKAVDLTARIAVLASPEDRSHDFVETVSRNSGMDLTIFTDPERAVRHLTEGS